MLNAQQLRSLLFDRRGIVYIFIRNLFICMLLCCLGIVLGVMTAIMNPLAWIGVIAFFIVILFWAMPDLPNVPVQYLSSAFFIAVITLLTLPSYYAVVIPGLPWLSVKRLAWFAMILLMLICISGSKNVRTRIMQVIYSNSLASKLIIGYLVIIFCSVFTSQLPSVSFKDAIDSLLYWYTGFFALLLVVNSEDRIFTFYRLISVSALIAAIVGAIEWRAEYRILYEVLPNWLKTALFVNNPDLADALSVPAFRNGQYRASFIYLVSLSFGEFAAIVAPITLYLIIHARAKSDMVLGSFALIGCIAAVVMSGSRGAYLGFAVAVVLTIILWICRLVRFESNSFKPIIATVSLVLSISFVGALIAGSRSVQVFLQGGGQGAASTDARFIQWELAKPWIFSNPITGHGTGIGSSLIGYFNPGATMSSVDSSAITILVETGVTGFILFFGLILVTIFNMIVVYIGSNRSLATFAGPAAAALLSFGIYRMALSQRENHALIFLVFATTFVIKDLLTRLSEDG